jgi:hypothetical protein
MVRARLEEHVMGGSIYTAIENWALRSRARSNALVDYLQETKSATLLPAAVVALAKHDRAAAHTTATGFLRETDVEMRSGALLALGAIPYPDDSDGLLTLTLKTLEEYFRLRERALEPALVQAFFALGKSGADVTTALVELSTSVDSRTRFTVAHVLFIRERSQGGHPDG